jgi:WD40 repeat protein
VQQMMGIIRLMRWGYISHGLNKLNLRGSAFHLSKISAVLSASFLPSPFTQTRIVQETSIMPPRTATAASSGPESGSGSDSESEQTSSSQRRKRNGKSSGGMGESAQKRRLVGEREELEDDAPPRFRHLGHVRQTRVACFMFCYQELLRGVRDSDDCATLAALPPELITLIVRYCVLGSAVVRFTHPEALEHVTTLQVEGQVRTLEFFTAADGVQFLASGGDGDVNLWDLSTRDCVATLEGHTKSVWCLASFSDANGAPLLASGSMDHTIIIWDVVAHTQVARLSDHTDWVTALSVYRNAAGLPCLASGCLDGSIKLWDLRTHTVAAALSHEYVQSLCVFSDADGTDFLVSSGGLDNSIRVWDLATHENLFALRGREGFNSLTCFTSEQGLPMLVNSGRDGITVWDLGSRVAVKTLDDSDSLPKSLVCVAGPDGRVMLSYTGGHHPRTGTILDLSTGRPVFQIPLTYADVLDAYVDRVSGVPFFAVAGFVDNADASSPAVVQLYTDPGGA